MRKCFDKIACWAGGAGVRACSHLQAGQTAAGWGQGAGHLLRAALHRVLPAGRPEDDHAGGAAAGGEDDDDDVDDDMISVPGSDQGLRDGLRGRCGLLPGQQRHGQRGKRGERPPQHKVQTMLSLTFQL